MYRAFDKEQVLSRDSTRYECSPNNLKSSLIASFKSLADSGKFESLRPASRQQVSRPAAFCEEHYPNVSDSINLTRQISVILNTPHV